VKLLEIMQNFSYNYCMNYQKRDIETKIDHTLARGKSILLLGARQTGKTTLLNKQCRPDLYYDFAKPSTRHQFERNPDSLSDEIAAYRLTHPTEKPPLIIIDEAQKVPLITDVAQYLIDNQKAQFILTGSSARKLKHNHHREINLLPGRVIKLHLDPLMLSEISKPLPDITTLLLYGSLPDIYLEPSNQNKEEDLISYVNIYLEEEIRLEALTRNLASFSRFLELAAIEAGALINFAKLSQDIGINVHLLSEYFQILEDCLIVDKILPLIDSQSRRRLTKAPKYLFFDLGVRRICAKEGAQLSEKSLGNLFEQFIGIELNRYLRLHAPTFRLRYWRDHNGPEVDYIIDMNHVLLPIEVKWTTNPTSNDCKHLKKFLDEYPCHELAYVVCQTPRKRMLQDRIMALPWQELPEVLTSI
jgi:uncharacterized protein